MASPATRTDGVIKQDKWFSTLWDGGLSSVSCRSLCPTRGAAVMSTSTSTKETRRDCQCTGEVALISTAKQLAELTMIDHNLRDQNAA